MEVNKIFSIPKTVYKNVFVILLYLNSTPTHTHTQLLLSKHFHSLIVCFIKNTHTHNVIVYTPDGELHKWILQVC